jgi:hypothetical protein
VAGAAQTLGAFVRGKGSSFHIIGLRAGPDGKSIGIDDWRAANPGATFADLKKLEIIEQLDLGAINYKACKAKIDEKFAVDTVSDEIIKLGSGRVVSIYTFDKLAAAHHKYTGSDGKERSAAVRWREDADHNTRNGRVWLPGAPNPTVRNEYNEFAPLPAPSVDIPMDLVMANLNGWFFPLLHHNYAVEVERKYLLYLIMLKRRNPAFKAPIGAILWGNSGSGKSLLFRALGSMLFGEYFSCPNKDQLKSSFNASWAQKKLIVLCEEIESPDNRADKSNLKNRISEASLSINAKFQQEQEVTDYLFYLFTSNHVTSFPLDPAAGGDRRFFVSEVSSGKLENAHKGLGARVFGMLQPETSLDPEKARRDCQLSADCLRTFFDRAEFEAFDLGCDAMMTPAKQRMYRLQRTDLARRAHELVEETRVDQMECDDAAIDRGQLQHPTYRNLLLLEKSAMLFDGNNKRCTQWRNALEMAGAKQLPSLTDSDEPRQVRIGANTYRPFALINFDYWNKVDAEVLKDAVKELVDAYTRAMSIREANGGRVYE